MPPKGRRGSDLTMPLMKTLPDSIWGASNSAAAISRVQRLAPRPYEERLARRMASSASRAEMRAATGPKVSSVKAGFAAVTLVRIVGAEKKPRRGRRGPPGGKGAPAGGGRG